MRVLCCLDGTNVDQVSKATEMLSTSEPLAVGLIYVTVRDTISSIFGSAFCGRRDHRRHERKRCGRPRNRLPKIS
jgi:hypothetical protein